MKGRAPLLLLLAVTTTAHAARITATSVDRRGDDYLVHFSVDIDAAPAAVRARMTDYDHLKRLSDTVRESRIVARHDGVTRVALVLHACVWIFCRDLRKVVDARTAPDGDVVTHVVPAQSDFKVYDERWRIRPQGQRTRVRYDARVVPDFFVPPLIGPYIMKRKIQSELALSARKLERLAQ